MVGQGGERGGSAARVQPPRDDERPCHTRPVESRPRAEGRVTSSPSPLNTAKRGQKNDPRLCLVTLRLADNAVLAGAIDDAIAAGDVAAVLVRLEPSDERALINRVKA